MESIIFDIRKVLLELQDAAYRDFQIKLIPSVDSEKIIGVRTLALRKLARDLSKRDDVDVFMNDLPHGYFEENQLHAFINSGIVCIPPYMAICL